MQREKKEKDLKLKDKERRKRRAAVGWQAASTVMGETTRSEGKERRQGKGGFCQEEKKKGFLTMRGIKQRKG